MIPRSRLPILLVCASLRCGFAQDTNRSAPDHPRPADWAVPVVRSGLPNCFQLTTNFYRGAQPTPRGMSALQAMGIKTVVNLRTLHSDNGALSGTRLRPERLKMEPWHVDDDQVIRFLRIVLDTNSLPVFVHCERGADRTGTMCAVYRIACCGWSKAEAIRELKEGGFGFNPAWRNLVDYLEQADFAELKRRAGLRDAH